MSIPGVLFRRIALPVVLIASASLSLDAQQRLTAADYTQAERFMGYNTTPLVLHSSGRPTWVSDQNGARSWYRTTTEKGGEAISVNAADGGKSSCDLPACRASANETGRGGGPRRLDVRSPDGKRTAFIRDWNLWVRDVASGRETQLTKDRVKDFGYATDNPG